MFNSPFSLKLTKITTIINSLQKGKNILRLLLNQEITNDRILLLKDMDKRENANKYKVEGLPENKINFWRTGGERGCDCWKSCDSFMKSTVTFLFHFRVGKFDHKKRVLSSKNLPACSE